MLKQLITNYVPPWATRMDEMIRRLPKDKYMRWLNSKEGKKIPLVIREIQNKKYDEIKARCFA